MNLAFLSKDLKRKSVYKFYEDGGENLYFKGISLNNESIVFDVGGFYGDFTEQVLSICTCDVYIFEPVKKFHEAIEKRYLNNKKIYLFNAGLSNKDSYTQISLEGSSSSVFKNSQSNHENIKLISAVDFIRNNNIRRIDFIKINIEGGEYDLLETLCEDKEIVNSVKTILIQFHDFVPDAENRRKSIQQKLSLTHKQEWDYPFIWERWTKKEL